MAASKTLLQQLTVDEIQKIYSVGTNEKNDFHELRQQHKRLRAMEMNEIGPDINGEGYIHQFQPGCVRKIQ